MKEYICIIMGMIGGFLTLFLGGWDSCLISLTIFVVIDYVTGIILAGIFHKSVKTESGTLSSIVGWKGICKKAMTFVIVVVANQLDIILKTDYIRYTTIIGFLANELISIVENVGLMGVPLPKVILRAFDILNGKEIDQSEVEECAKKN